MRKTHSPLNSFSFTKETHLTWVTEQENKAGVWHWMPLSNAAGDLSLGRSAGNFGELNILGAPAAGPEQVHKECWPFFLSLSSPAMDDGVAAATWSPTPTSNWRTKAPARNHWLPSYPLPWSLFPYPVVPLLPLFRGHWLSLGATWLFAEQANIPLSLLNFTILQVLVTVITNTINHLHSFFKSIQIVSGLCVI